MLLGSLRLRLVKVSFLLTPTAIYPNGLLSQVNLDKSTIHLWLSASAPSFPSCLLFLNRCGVARVICVYINNEQPIKSICILRRQHGHSIETIYPTGGRGYPYSYADNMSIHPIEGIPNLTPTTLPRGTGSAGVF